MEPNEPLASRPLVKRERSPDLGHLPDAPAPKRQAPTPMPQAAETSGVAQAPVQFPWRTCNNLGDAQRLKIKEEAVILAETYCENIRKALGSVLETKSETPEAVMMGQRIVKHWCAEYDEIRTKHRRRQILVGVEGPTGAGKSSFLGSLLKIPELFPSGQESAATAVIGKASWNWDDEPGHEFRAKVYFRTKDEVEQEVISLLKELNRWSALIAGTIDDDDDDGSRADTIAISRSTIEHQLPRALAVWGMTEERLLGLAKKCPNIITYKDAVRRVFYKNFTATQFLTAGQTEFNESTAEKLSKAIKPFLDSSPNAHGGTNQFSAWPLVKGVHILVKAAILKPGITLVDLPGCGDAVESRSQVAEKVSHTLDVRLVVSPIIRATDEKQGQTLMQNGFDEAQMRIRGKLDGRGFCVIASKMDDMKVDSYIQGCLELADDTEVIQKQDKLAALKDEKEELKEARRELKVAKKQAESQKKKASKQYDKAKTKHEAKLKLEPNTSDSHLSTLSEQRDAKASAFTDADRRLDECELRQTQVATEMRYTRDWIAHQAVQTRNTRVMKRLRADFAMRQARLDHGNTPTKSQADKEYVLPILPVSTRAFWQLDSKDEPIPGFPDKRYTGIPAAEQWLHRATLAKREKHLDETLDGYQKLMTMMRIYSAVNAQNGDFNFTRSQVEVALAGTHEYFTNRMGSKLAEACTEIDALDPVEHKARAKKRFLREAQRIVQKWAYKYPDDENSVERMHFCTYYANIRRKGSMYRNRTNGVTYTWIENLAAPILKTLSRDWDRKMNKQLPLIKRPMVSDYSRLFTEYLNALQMVINEKVPPLATCFSNMRPILEDSQRATETQIGEVLGTLSEKAAIVTVNAVKYLQDVMNPTFIAAEADRGAGSYARRKETIQTKIREDENFICDQMISRLVDGVAERKAEVPAQLIKAAAEGPRIIQQQLSFLVNNLAENCSTDPVMNAKKAKVQDDVRAHIEAWEIAWASERDYEEHILELDLSIPKTIPEPVFDEGPEDEDMDDSGGENDDDET